MVCASVVCAESDERARELAAPSALGFLKLRSGQPSTTPTPEEAATYDYSAAERAFIDDRLDSQILGSAETVERGVRALLGRTAADELMITTATFDPADRRRSFDLVAGFATDRAQVA